MGGWTFAHLAFGSYLQVASWTPWILFALESYLRAPNLKWILAAGLAGGMQSLAGAPQLAIYCQAGIALYALALLMEKTSVSFTLRLRAIFLFVVFQALLALGLSAPAMDDHQRLCCRL